MGLFSILGNGLQTLFGKPKSFSTGEKFEQYIRKHLLTAGHYELLQKTHGYRTKNKNYVPSTAPDFKFRDRQNGKLFYVEAKYRKSFFKGQVSWCTERQLQYYRRSNRECPVFILLGVGGNPDKPAFVSLISLEKVNFIQLYQSFTEKYAIHPEKRIGSRILWRRH
jgi:hypothetical protein